MYAPIEPSVSRPRRVGRVRFCLLLVAALALILGGLADLRRSPSLDGSLTPDIPAVAPLRRAVSNANVVIIVIDAARADHLGCYGYPRPTTPNLDRIAAEGTIFTNHFCQIPMTTASTVSLFTAEFPDSHGIYSRAADDWQPSLTLAGALSRVGFRTALFSSNPSASPAVGIGREFDQAFYRIKPVDKGRSFSPKSLLLEFDRWLPANRDRRFFAYLHFLPPHNPYHQPDEFLRLFDGPPPGYRVEHYTPLQCAFPMDDSYKTPDPLPLPGWISLYDANLRYADWAVGEVVAKLRETALLSNTILLITSDHGEAFGEHGYIWHVPAIHDEVTHIPLLLKLPGEVAVARRIDCLTQTIDLLPTLCDLLAVPYPKETVQGRSLLPVLAGREERAGSYTIIKSLYPTKYMIRDQRHALLIYPDHGLRALYDLAADPRQQADVIAETPDRARKLHDTFAQHVRANARTASVDSDQALTQLPDDTRRSLEALGYLD